MESLHHGIEIIKVNLIQKSPQWQVFSKPRRDALGLRLGGNEARNQPIAHPVSLLPIYTLIARQGTLNCIFRQEDPDTTLSSFLLGAWLTLARFVVSTPRDVEKHPKREFPSMQLANSSPTWISFYAQRSTLARYPFHCPSVEGFASSIKLSCHLFFRLSRLHSTVHLRVSSVPYIYSF